MQIRHLAVGLAMATPLFVQANYSINNSAFSCSAALSFANSTGLDAHCTGNFSVTGGTWTSDTKIALSADGTLTLDGVAITAPIIELLSPEVVLNASLEAPGGSVRIDAPRDLKPGTPLEPTLASPLQSGGSLQLSAGSSINTSESFSSGSHVGNSPQDGSIQIRGGSPIAVPGAITTDSAQPPLTFSSSVPEPDTNSLALVALATFGAGAALARRCKA